MMLSLYKDLNEVTERRSVYSKTFGLGDDKYKLVCARHPIHHDKGNGLEDIDLVPKEVEGGFAIEGPGWTADFIKQSCKFALYHGDKVFEAESFDNPDMSDVQIKNRGIEITEAWPGVDLYLCIRPRGLEWYKRIKNPEARHAFSWKTSKPDPVFHYRKVPEGMDSNGNKVILSHTKEENSDHDVITERFDKKVAIRDKKTRVAKSSSSVEYPVFIDVPDVSVSIGAGGDDAGQNPGGVNTSESVNYVGRAGGANFDVGVRFGGVNIPQGATIDDAKIKTRMNREGSNGAAAKIYGVDIDNLGASPWSTIRGKTKTTNSVVFATTVSSGPNFFDVTHNVTGPIQEIISRTGWSSGNGLGLIALQTGTATAQSNIAMYEHATEAAPLLEVNYTSAGGSTLTERGVVRGTGRGVVRGV